MGQPSANVSWLEPNVTKIGKGVWACQVMQCWGRYSPRRTLTSVQIRGNRKAARQVGWDMLELYKLREGGET